MRGRRVPLPKTSACTPEPTLVARLMPPVTGFVTARVRVEHCQAKARAEAGQETR